MRIRATPVTGRELVAGDLFSIVGPEYWDRYAEHHSIGERVYIRTSEPAESADDADVQIYRIEVER